MVQQVFQETLFHKLKSIFPKECKLDIFLESRKLTEIKYDTNKYAELDVWIPNLNLAFEFQKLTEKSGIHLVIVPCWWDGSLETLGATISFQRPDLSLPFESHNSISLNPPCGFLSATILPDVGELMLASFSTSLELTPENKWWLGEKYDGIRCCWNPLQKKLHGRVLSLFPQIENKFPSIILDSEVWFGRGMFASAAMIYREQIDAISWDQFRMVSFDCPAAEFQNIVFEKRYEYLQNHLNPHNPVSSRLLCTNNNTANFLLKEIIEKDGEGLIMRKMGSVYERGRSSSLIKLKTYCKDLEGLVVDTGPEFVKLKLPSGNFLLVPNTNVQISIPSKGEIVTFSYETSTRGILPVNPIITRIRNDIVWKDILLDFNSSFEPKRGDRTSHAPGHWTIETMREYLIQLAKSHNLDPLLPQSWYSLPAKALYLSKSGKAIMQKFESYPMALKTLFPEIDFVHSSLPQSSWSQVKFRRTFFEDFAKSNNFDPLVANNWYLTTEAIMQEKAAPRVIHYHGNSVAMALVDLFPEIGLDFYQFGTSKNYPTPLFASIESRKLFFDEIAQVKNFDPLVASNWESFTKDTILSLDGGASILQYYNNSVRRALCDVYPSLSTDKNFVQNRTPYWQVRENRKRFFVEFSNKHGFDSNNVSNWARYGPLLKDTPDGAMVLSLFQNNLEKAVLDAFPEGHVAGSRISKFFDKYAKENNFDPLVPENWYKINKEDLLSAPGASILINYRSKIGDAIHHAYPKIGLDITEFNSKKYNNYWSDADNRRAFFDSIGKKLGFDPLLADSWYSISRDSILKFKGAISVLKYHNRSLTRALVDLYPEIGLDKFNKFRKELEKQK